MTVWVVESIWQEQVVGVFATREEAEAAGREVQSGLGVLDPTLSFGHYESGVDIEAFILGDRSRI